MKKYILLFVFFTSILYSNPNFSQRLIEEMDHSLKNDTYIKSLVILKDQFDILALDQQLYNQYVTIKKRVKTVIESLKKHSEYSQEDILSYLKSFPKYKVRNIKSFWITNMIAVEAKADVLLNLIENENIAAMDVDRNIILEEFIKGENVINKTPGLAEPCLKVINAHKLWRLGYTGTGRIVMNIDTGVDPSHPALGWRWRGNYVPDSVAWYDPVYGTNIPSDGNDHGTATMGIMCGLDSITHDTIGVAFKAEWIASNALWGSPLTSYVIASFQWALNPDGNPSTIDDMPDVINCSWHDPFVGFCDSTYINVFNAVESAGIAIIFSGGAGGPSASSISKPANINTNEVNTWATGVIDGNTLGYPITASSGRGPTQCAGGGASSLDIKPEACAPGVNIRTSVNNSSYHIYSGSSMAAAHVSGAVALLKEAFPQLTGYEIKMALYNTALDLGEAGEDNIYGMGLIDIYAAFMSLNPNSIDRVGNKISGRFALHQNFPNPFNPSTTIKYDLKAKSDVKLTIYNVLGQKVRTLVRANQAAGYKNVVWDGLNDMGEQVSTGVYIYRIEAGDFFKSRKMIFMK